MSYSIWMIPKEREIREYLQTTVENLANEYQQDTFEPHITLLGDLDRSLEEIQGACENLSGKISPLKLETGEIEYSTTYYQCVFVRIKPIPELMEVYDLLKLGLGITKPSVFMPHISLMYGNIPYIKRDQIARALEIKPLSFTLEAFVITPGGEKPPSEWEHLVEIGFDGSNTRNI